MSNFKKVGSNTFWQIGSRAVNSISGLIIIYLINTTYGQNGVGIYTIIIGYIGFFFMPVDFGLNAIAVKHIINNDYPIKHVIKNLLGIRLILATALILIALAIMSVLPFDPQTNTGYSADVKAGVVVISITILAQAIIATSNAYFQAKQQYLFSFVANTVAAVTNTLLLYLLILSNAPLITAIGSFSASGLIGCFTGLLIVKRYLKDITPEIQTKYLKTITKETLPLTLSIMLNLVYFRIDTLIVPFFRQVEEVGKYNVAYKVFDAILVIPNYFTNAVYPVLLEKYKTGQSSFTTTIKKSVIALGAVSIIATFAMYFLSPWIIRTILGTWDDQATLYLRILTSGLVSFFLSSIAMWSLIIINKQKYLTYIYGTTMLINIALNVIFIPIYGALASAVITIITEVLVLLLSGILVIRNFKIDKAHIQSK
jgi:O-antigen/teichoic acid export membrane protein